MQKYIFKRSVKNCVKFLYLLSFVLFILILIYQLKPPKYHKVKNNACKFPYLPIDDPEIMKHIETVEPINCANAEPDWIITNLTHAFLCPDHPNKENTQCRFSTIQRDDHDMSYKLVKTNTKGNIYEFRDSDFIKVVCKSNIEFPSHSSLRWKGYFAVPRPIKRKPKLGKSQLNALIWGHDSLSRNMFMRKLPITYNYIKNELGGIVLKKYNIIGDGTPQALIPILTGKTELELPEARSRFSNATFVNAYPFIWNEFSEKGYITAFNEDSPDIGTFSHRHKGFDAQPTDYYLRPFFLGSKRTTMFCQGSVPLHMKMVNYFKDILAKEPEIPKFIFSFYSELSHGSINNIQGADSDIKDLFHHLQSTNVLNNSILIVMNDHGHRFTDIRKTQQGKQEERLPMFMFIFPPWFKEKYPKAHKNFLANSETLSNPFDIHATLKDILNLDELPESHFDIEVPLSREMSLFQKIPPQRNCKDAEIENHWCACLEWFPLNNNTLAQRVASEFVSAMNNWTSSHSDICARLEVSRVLSSTYFVPKKDLLKFLISADMDGRIPDLTAETPIRSMTIQIKVETKPGLGNFEVSSEYNLNTNALIFKESDISRIDKYGAQAKCVDNALLENLRKYCYCI